MPLPGFDDLLARTDSRSAPVRIVAAGGADATVLSAMQAARARGWIEPIVCGADDAIRAVAADAGLSLEGIHIVDGDDAAASSVAEIRAGRADMLLKGLVSTPQLMRAILHEEWGLRTGATICQVVLMDLPDRGRRFLLADTGVCIAPTIEQKIEIMNSAVAVAHRLGCPQPRVALMAATESRTEAMPETMDAAEITRRHGADDEASSWCELPDCFVQGPLSFDLAFDDSAATRKRVGGPVVGVADVLLFPNLVSANLTVKAIMYTAHCRFGGILCGVACPVVFMSRSDSAETRLRSMALAIAMLD